MPGRLILTRRSKYRNRLTRWGNLRFDSKRELAHWLTLVEMEKTGTIRDLRRQVRFKLSVNGVLICTYVADFTYRLNDRGTTLVVEDAKGFRTREYRLKKKLMLACHGIEVLEV